MEIIGLIIFVLAMIGYWRLTRAFYEMRDQLRTQTELMRTQTRLLAAIANAAEPVESVTQR